MNDKTMKILVVEPEKKPYIKEIDGSLAAMQKIVGGSIEAVYPFEDRVALVANEEGKLLNLPPNRLLIDENRRPYDIICGTFFVAGLGEEDFVSLTDEQAKRYNEMYSREMLFLVPNTPQKHRGKAKEATR